MKKIFIRLIIACCVACVFTAIGFNNSFIRQIINLDLVEYFVSGKVIREHGNPYSYDIQTKEQCTENMEYKEEWGIKKPICPTMFYNPPTALTSSILISYISSYKVASYVWFFFIIFIFLCCFFILYDLFVLNNRSNLTSFFKGEECFYNYLFMIIVLTFEPFIDNLFFGQISFLLLLGLTLSIYFEKHGKIFWSAVSLSLTAIKPHALYLYYFFWFFFADCKCSKIKGLLTGIIIFSLLPLVYNLHIYFHYLDFMSSNLPSTKWFSATIGAWIASSTNFFHPIISLLPAFITTLLCLFFLIKTKIKEITLETRVLIVIPLSLFTMSYGWSFDMVTLLPTLCLCYHVIVTEINLNHRNKILLLAGLMLVNILFFNINMKYGILLSLSYLLFSCYLIVLRSKREVLERNKCS